MKRCFIYSAGTFYGLRERPQPGDYQIAADAGLLLCQKLGIEPDRLDHTLANLQSLAFLRRHGARGYLYDDNFVYTVIENERLTVRQTVDWGLLSIFNLGADAEGLTLRGVQYELTDAPLGSAFPLGVSNHIITPQAEIDVRRGLLLVGWELPPLKNL